MKCRLKKIGNLSGNKASVYSVIINESDDTLLEVFLKENADLHLKELSNILLRVKTMGNKTGIIDDFLKIHEGKFGDGVCALYDVPNSKLRVYCIRYGAQIIIIGGGGIKTKQTRALQDSPKLKEENYLMRRISAAITQNIIDKNIRYSDNGLEFEGDLEFNI
ncbi:hypothetical protein SDC9_87877 [bioreactor metagenome]|uniref:Uncharacterized protein n=1 Tax=bioreactor metagenome TaxID=1076179 RepID=A0A644ZKH1_9ZZZZ